MLQNLIIKKNVTDTFIYTSYHSTDNKLCTILSIQYIVNCVYLNLILIAFFTIPKK